MVTRGTRGNDLVFLTLLVLRDFVPANSHPARGFVDILLTVFLLYRYHQHE